MKQGQEARYNQSECRAKSQDNLTIIMEASGDRIDDRPKTITLGSPPPYYARDRPNVVFTGYYARDRPGKAFTGFWARDRPASPAHLRKKNQGLPLALSCA
jgi:hypothetical protein